MVVNKYEYRAIAINPFDNWVYGSLLVIKDRITEEVEYYIQTDDSRITVAPDTICRKVHECDGVKYFDKDILEFDYHEDEVRRIEPIIDTGLTVYIGRNCNIYGFNFFGNDSLNIKVIGNTIENKDLLNKKWDIL